MVQARPRQDRFFCNVKNHRPVPAQSRKLKSPCIFPCYPGSVVKIEHFAMEGTAQSR